MQENALVNMRQMRENHAFWLVFSLLHELLFNATYEAPTRHQRAASGAPTSHPKATSMRHQSHLKAC